jgi:hypothetical protein
LKLHTVGTNCKMSNGLIIVGFIASASLIAVSYYMVIPAYYNVKLFFEDKVTDPNALTFGEMLYRICGVFPILFLFAVFLKAYNSSVRQRSADSVGI